VNLVTLTTIPLVTLALLGTGGAGGYAIRGRLSANLCPCGHAATCVDKFTGYCTATVIETSYVGGVRRTRKRVPCPCRQHKTASLGELLEVPHA
jgi:hypothetical protein